MNNIIEVRNLNFNYNDRPVLHDVNFDISRGDFTGIIGSNGSGKSTLLKLVLGLLRPSGGSITLFGVPVQRFRDWPKIGYVAQKNQLQSGFPASVYEVVSANLYAQTGLLHMLSKQQKQKVADVLNTVGLLGRKWTPVSNLSGGQQQRVHLARVLVNDPEILLMDEPAAGMDSAAENSMYELLHTLNKDKNISIIMVTHDITAVTAHASRLFCMGDMTLREHEISDAMDSAFLSKLYGHNVHVHVHTDHDHAPKEEEHV